MSNLPAKIKVQGKMVSNRFKRDSDFRLLTTLIGSAAVGLLFFNPLLGIGYAAVAWYNIAPKID
jgi:hypothetical protein